MKPVIRIFALCLPLFLSAGERNLLPSGGPAVLEISAGRKHILFPQQGKEKDFSAYDTLKLTFHASRAGEKFMLLLTSNPDGVKTWNYYCSLVRIESAGKTELSIPFRRLAVNRKPAGFDRIDSVGIWFEGWNLKTEPGLRFELLELKLENNGEKERLRQEAKVREFSALLPSRPWAVVPHCSDRTFYERWKETPYGRDIARRAKAVREEKTPLKAPPDEYYLDYTRKSGPFAGVRYRYERAANAIRKNLFLLALDYAMTGNSVDLPLMEHYIREWCNGMRTWVCPAHDEKLTNFHRTRITIDLVSSGNAALATELAHMLKGRISQESETLLKREISRQVLDPLNRALADGSIRDIAWWFGGKSNWTAVCHSGLLITLLGSDLEPARRAEMLYRVVQAGENYLTGFSPDGYCSEGPAYWSYGFGHYLTSAGVLFLASEGKINLLDHPAARRAAEYPERIMLTKHLFPPLADCQANGRIGPELLTMRDWLLNRHSPFWKGGDPKHYDAACSQLVHLRIPAPPWKVPADSDELPALSKFDHAQVYIARPGKHRGVRMSALFKGGHNNEMHNHNDTGSFLVAVGDTMLLVDPGATVYNRKTFSGSRYQNRILNSFCHNVPVLAGSLQAAGKGTEALLLRTSESKEHFEVALDLRKPYRHVGELERFERVMRYERREGGIAAITDSVAFRSPQSFETALNTFGAWRRIGENRIAVSDGSARCVVSIDTGGVPFRITETQVLDDISCGKPVCRLGIRLNGPVRTATVKMTISAE